MGLQRNSLLTKYFFQRMLSLDMFIARKVVKVADVPEDADGNKPRTFRVVTTHEGPYKIPDAGTGPKGKVRQIDIDPSTTDFTVLDKYLQRPIDKIDESQATWDEKSLTAKTISYLLSLIHEKEIGDTLFTAANYATGYKTQLLAGNQFTDTASAPLNIIKTGIRKCSAWPTDIVFGIEAWDAFCTHPDVLKAFGIEGGAAGIVGAAIAESEVAKYFGVKQVSVGREKYDAADEGVAADEQFIWGPHVSILHQDVNPDTESLAHTLCFSQLQADAMEFFKEDPGPLGADYVRAGWNRVILVKNSKMGYFIEDAA